MDTELEQRVDDLAVAEARQTAAYLRILGLEEEMHEARDAYLRLVTDFSMRYRDACAVWREAKTEVAEQNRRLDGMFK